MYLVFAPSHFPQGKKRYKKLLNERKAFMKIEFEITEKRYELIQRHAERCGVSADAYINFALYELLRKQGAFGKSQKS